MADTSRRVPLWLVGVVGGLAILSLIGVFIFGSYSGLGSSL
jgi:photosystem II PsbJ protein